MKKSNSKIYLAGMLMLFCIGSLKAQNNTLKPDLANIVLPSPSAAALGKFGSIPVSMSNGIPNITVPIFQRERGPNKCGLSISLDYHAGGIRVDEIASNVGLGWALNAGGVVTRTIRGIADESTLSDAVGFLAPGHTLPGSAEGMSYTPLGSTYYVPGRMISDGRLDGQIDVYSFHFNGKSGKFWLGKNGDIQITPQQKLIIERTVGNGSTSSSKITITAEDGFKYEFGEEETTFSSNWAIRQFLPTSWYLSKILSPSRTDSIMFQYETFSGSYTVSNTASEVYSSLSGYLDNYHHYRNAPSPPYSFSNGPVTEEGYYKRLIKLLLPEKTEINFTYDLQNRTDWSNDKALKAIAISNSGRISKRYQLDQKYSSNRLFLNKVILKDAIDTVVGNYAFEYTDDSLLPERLSANQDHWGFPNNNQDGRMIPKEYALGKTYAGGDRNSNGWAIRGSLKKVTYPTGGYTLFEMEPNWARDTIGFSFAQYYVDGLFNFPGSNGSYTAESMIGGVRMRKISDYDGINSAPATVREYNYTYPDGKSSGVIANYPRYSSVAFYEFDWARPGDNQYPPTGYWDYPFQFYPVSGYNEPYTKYQPFNVINRSSSSLSNLSFSMGSPVTYKRVEEKILSVDGTSSGKTVRTFSAFWDYGPPANYSDFDFPQPPLFVSDWLYGLLKAEMVYDSNGRLIQKTENRYDQLQDTSLPRRLQNFRSVATGPVKFISDIYNPVLGGAPLYWLVSNFYPAAGRTQLSGSTTTTFDTNGDSSVVNTNITYDPLNFYLRSKSVQRSDESWVTTTNRYPKDMVNEGKDPSGVYSQMVNRNIISPLIEQVDTLTRSNASQQLKWVGMQYFNPLGSLYVTKSSAIKNQSYPVDTIAQFSVYDNRGNILEQQKVNDVKEVYLWSYLGQFPVAKIVNADFATVNSVITQTQIDNAAATSDVALRTLLNTLRTDSRLKNAQITTFTYDPIAGITSSTDTRGQTVFYEYDSFQRLKIVKDNNGKISKVLDYQYSKPVTQ